MYRIFIFIFIISNSAFGQSKNSIWVFGDSAGINFQNINNPIPFSSTMDGRGSCANISDSTGQLLFYSYTVANTVGNTTRVLNRQNNLMDNGDSIVGESWYQELIILPFPSNNNLFYLFSIGCTGLSMSGLFYSVVDMSANGGLGKVVTKNSQLSSLYGFDALAAIRHGNGRDWWLIFKPEGYLNNPNNDFFIYLISPLGISSPTIQSIGEIVSTNGGSISFSLSGDKMIMIDLKNLIEVFDFDRCTGQLSNPNIIEFENQGQTGVHWGSCFSPNSKLIYITHIQDGPGYNDSWVYQYNLDAPNIALSRDTVFHTVIPNQVGKLKLGPDNKIYLSSWYIGFIPGYPFPDSIHNSTNENLSIIAYPDSVGAACGFQPFSFYLGGKRTYSGLPNNPDYEMSQLSGSICDTLGVGIKNEIAIQPHLNVFYHSGWQTAFINASGLTTGHYELAVFDISGRKIFEEEGSITGHSFTRNLDCSGIAKGLYIVSFVTNDQNINRRLLID